MSFLGSLGEVVGGFNEESGKIRQENQRRSEMDQARSDKVFDALANADDPDIRAAAVTGLLTGSHPAKGLDKWFGKMSEHPAYEQIKGLVSEGHQPFMNPADRKAAEKASELDAAVKFTDAHGAHLEPPQVSRMAMGMVGAAPPRTAPRQAGTITFSDGHEEPGSFEQETGIHYDQAGEPVYDAKGFRRNTGSGTGGSPSTGGKWTTEKDANSSTGWSSVHRDAAGKELGRAGNVAAPASTVPSYAAAPQPGYVLDTKSGRYVPAGGEPGAGAKPETETQSAEALRGIESRIMAMHPAPKATQFLPVTPEAEAQHRAALDAEAKNYHYDNFAALQADIAQATSGVSAAVATPPPTPPVPQPGGAKPKPAKKVGSRSGLDIDAIKAQLAKDHGGPAGAQ